MENSFKNRKIGVLMGGLSKEREVSLRTGAAIAQALQSKGYTISKIDVGHDVGEQLRREKIEIAFIALHGRYGEDGSIQGLLEVAGIPYTGSGILPSAIAMDKELTKKIVSVEGIRTPQWKIVTQDSVETVHPTGIPFGQESPLPLPMIVKPNREGSTIGIGIVREEKDFVPALQGALKFDESVLIEEFITGTEVTVAILNGRVLPIVEIVPKSGFYDFTSKYTKGMTDYIVPARISEEVRKNLEAATQKVYKTLKLSGVARMDYMIKASGEDYFLEVNTIPGMTETSLVPKAAAAAGISFEELCEEILSGAALKI